MNKKTKKIIIILITAAISAALIYFLYRENLYSSIKTVFSSAKEFKAFVTKQGSLAPVIFFLIQIAQVIIAPIPGNVTALAGGALFGGAKACLLSCSGIIIGSFIAFFIARIFGKPLVVKLIGESIFNKYNKVFLGKCGIALFLLFLLPFFPDDALCFLAGLSKLPAKAFFLFTVIGRLPNIIFASLAGAGTVYVSAGGWIVIGILSAAAIYLSFRYGDKIEKRLYSKFHFE